MPIKAVIWDIGGVIARTEDLAPRDQLAAELGVTRDHLNYIFFSGPDGTRAQNGEISRAELIALARSDLGLAPDECPNLVDRFFGGDIVDDDLVGYIRSLKPRYKTGIISNAWSGLPLLLEEWDIIDAFDVVVGSGDEDIMKPAPRIYQIALKRLSVAPDEAVFVDDFIENIIGARELGINAIHFQSREQALRDLKSLLDL